MLKNDKMSSILPLLENSPFARTKKNHTLEFAQLDEAESAGKPLQIFELIIFN